MGRNKLVYRLAVVAIFLAGFLIGGAYIRYIDVIDGYNADMVQDAVTRLEEVQTKYQQKFTNPSTGSNIMIQPVATPATDTSNIMIQL